MWKRLHVKYPLSDLNETWIFSADFREKAQIYFIKIRPVGAELFHMNGQRDGNDKANSRFSQFCECAYNPNTRSSYYFKGRLQAQSENFINRPQHARSVESGSTCLCNAPPAPRPQFPKEHCFSYVPQASPDCPRNSNVYMKMSMENQ
jgi:hypothetical protein